MIIAGTKRLPPVGRLRKVADELCDWPIGPNAACTVRAEICGQRYQPQFDQWQAVGQSLHSATLAVIAVIAVLTVLVVLIVLTVASPRILLGVKARARYASSQGFELQLAGWVAGPCSGHRALGGSASRPLGLSGVSDPDHRTTEPRINRLFDLVSRPEACCCLMPPRRSCGLAAFPAVRPQRQQNLDPSPLLWNGEC